MSWKRRKVLSGTIFVRLTEFGWIRIVFHERNEEMSRYQMKTDEIHKHFTNFFQLNIVWSFFHKLILSK